MSKYLKILTGVAFILSAVMASPLLVWAHPWTSSGLQYWEQGTSTYAARAQMVSNAYYDFNGLDVQVLQGDDDGP